VSYRDDTETVRAENERLRAENAALRSTRWRQRAVVILAVVTITVAVVLVRRGGIAAELVTAAVVSFVWLPVFFRVRVE